MPKTQAASSGGPPRPPKEATRESGDESPEGPHINIPDPVVVAELATTLREKPFKIVADLMEFGVFVNIYALVSFEVASKVARKYGYYARRAA